MLNHIDQGAFGVFVFGLYNAVENITRGLLIEAFSVRMQKHPEIRQHFREKASL
ncbi:MAG: hypothetical protein KDH94_06535 [Coxiellaceae bacterium]|nr:hypothetical protein [Coxiellaceae bacterium]